MTENKKSSNSSISNEFECRCSIKALNTLLILTPPPDPFIIHEPSKHQKKYDIIMHELFTNQCDKQNILNWIDLVNQCKIL